jgi:hypothetical protein
MTAFDKVVGLIALACFIGFLSVLGSFVKEPALIVVLVLGVLMAGYDFWIELFRREPRDGEGEAG